MTLLEFLLATLATYRISHMVALEPGPFEIFHTIGAWVGKRYGEKSWQFEGINCVVCLSFWFSIPVVLLLKPGGVARFVLNWLGVAGAVMTAHKWIMKK